jgi:GH24 family phage-related lysozyme (muramidase)
MHPGIVSNKIRLLDLARYYKGLPHQTAALTELEEAINKANPHILGRDQNWFKTWSTAGKQTDLTAALKLIQEFEGCHLDAYLCPAGVPTIGWGNTRYGDGRPVKIGDKITRVEADLLLRQEVDRIVAKLSATVPHWKIMSDNQQGALVDFSYNLGAGFYGAKGFETITARLRNKDWTRVPEAMLLYRNPGSSFEAGLKRRREAEGRLWAEGLVGQAVQQLPYAVKPSDPFSTRLSANFTLGEFALGQPARRFQHQYQVDTAAELAAFLERVRVAFGNKRITITSGYRPAAINRSVGGASGSEHLYSEPGVGAVDFFVDGADIYAVQRWCDREWPFSLGYGAPKGFCHLGIRRGRPRVRWDYT